MKADTTTKELVKGSQKRRRSAQVAGKRDKTKK